MVYRAIDGGYDRHVRCCWRLAHLMPATIVYTGHRRQSSTSLAPTQQWEYASARAAWKLLVKFPSALKPKNSVNDLSFRIRTVCIRNAMFVADDANTLQAKMNSRTHVECSSRWHGNFVRKLTATISLYT